MSDIKEVYVPDIGDAKDVEVIEVLVNEGDIVRREDSLITLESDKATMDIPSPYEGKIHSILVHVGAKIAHGEVILTLEYDADTVVQKAPKIDAKVDTKACDIRCEVVVLGGGPGGYTAAFRAADLGKHTLLIERYATLGGVCLNVGCIPSKTLLHVAKVMAEIKELKKHGIDLGAAQIIPPQPIRQFAVNTVNKLTQGLKAMAKKRQVEVIHGHGRFISANRIEVAGESQTTTITFEHAIIAAGSQPIMISSLPDDPRIMDSTGALLLDDLPARLLVVGGGVIGLEMATVYEALGTKITLVEMQDALIPECDADIVRSLHRHIVTRYENIYLGTTLTKVVAKKTRLEVSFDGQKAPKSDQFDAILLAIGRRPNGLNIGAEVAGVNVDEQGFIHVDDQQRTNMGHIFAVGDIVGQPMLAHKATHEGKVAAEVIAGLKVGFDNRVIPSVAYTDPEVAWVGVTEGDAKAQGIDYGKGVFPWSASGRSLSQGRDEGMTKILFCATTHRIIGAGIVGSNAGELIAECALAIEMGADAEDLGLTIHPHPTLSETVGIAAEIFSGTATDLYLPKGGARIIK